MAYVNDEQGVWQTFHVLDSAQALLQFFFFAGQLQNFFFDQVAETIIFAHLFQRFEAFDGSLDGAEVSQHATQPAMRNVRHAALACCFFNGLACCALGANEHDGAATGRDLADDVHGVIQHGQGFFQVDDVDLATGSENVGSHLGIPVTGLVAEVHACFKHFAHGNVWHL